MDTLLDIILTAALVVGLGLVAKARFMRWLDDVTLREDRRRRRAARARRIRAQERARHQARREARRAARRD
jgi:hypothetical protein